ncbi:hypothetical protein [Streptomyces chartreusis]|uniref:hypothetical protein n=1 Tax=Streptomyces chartreusis TaxID=1969 RepID=UPI00382243AA
MTATRPPLTDVEHEKLARHATAQLGLEPRLLRLLTAVHEAGHAIVGSTLGFDVTAIKVSSRDVLGLHNHDHISVELHEGQEIRLPDELSLYMAGFQAACFWLNGRGIRAMAPGQPYKTALNTLAGGDINKCHNLCDQWDLPAVATTNEGVRGAAHVLKYRWRAVLRLAYTVDRVGCLWGTELQPYLDADPSARRESLTAYGKWLKATTDLWALPSDVAVPSQG